MNSKSQEIKNKLKDLKKQYLDAAQDEFKKASNELFEKYNRLKSFGWRQYTPYFNDGDVCEFSARTYSPSINGRDEYNDEDDDLINGENLYKAKDEEAKDIIKNIKDFLKMFDEDAYQSMFDDHVEITVTKDKVEVEHYEHD